MGLLGGFLLTVYMKSERKAVTVDAQVTSPKNFHLPIRNVSDVQHGPKASGVPGFLKGLWEIHQKFGSASWKDLIEPTARLCKDGVIITKHLYDSMHINKRIVGDPYLRELLVDKETRKFKRPGTKIIPTKHCEFLKLLANHSDPDIYSGVVGDMIAQDFEDVGSFITRDDLKEYKVKWSEAVAFPLANHDSLFIPNTAAVLIPSIINILKQYHLNSSSFDSEKNINATILTHHRIIEAFKHVFAVRSRLGDPDFVDVEGIVAHLLSPEYAQEIRHKIDDTKTFADPANYSAKFLAPDDHGTSHVSIIAANGDAISITSSINY